MLSSVGVANKEGELKIVSHNADVPLNIILFILVGHPA